MRKLFLLKNKLQIAGLLVCLLFAGSQAMAQKAVVTGTVKDPSGAAMPAVNVIIKGSLTGVTSDADGKFSIEASTDDVLVFSFIGYASQEIRVGAQTVINITMQEDITALQEVVVAITVKIANKKQEMIGFGGALTWYSNWLTTNNKLDEIADLMFNDLGIDIIRFKTWYYPNNYPTNKGVSNMSNEDNDYAKACWDATNQLYTLAKQRNPNIKILLSSWGPPISLKDNNKLQEGTLKKNGGKFMYDEFAEYWNDLLDYTPFNPDYISCNS